MRSHRLLTPGLALLAGVAAAPAAETGDKAPTIPKCTDFVIPVHARAPVKLIDRSTLPPNLDDPTVLQGFIASEASSGLAALLGSVGNFIQSGDFQMAARYCEPATYVASRARTIQYLQHAITNTKEYWNGLAYPEGVDGTKYSWIDVASSYGYPTIAIDNLGSGNSSRPDPITVVQMSLQIEIIHQIITRLRTGKVNGPLAGRKFDKVIYAGHSYGSICGNGLAATYPKDVDAFVLTGYTGEFLKGVGPLAAGLAAPAAVAMPQRFAGLHPGYLAQTYEPGRVYALYTEPPVGGYSPAVAQFDFDHSGTVAIGELATLLYGVTPAPAYTGSVYVLTGKQDAIVCNEPTGADCGSGATSKPAVAGKFWPRAADYTYAIPDATGHSANMHYSSPRSFQKVHQYLAGRGF